MEKRRVLVTGMGTVNPLGHDLPQSWQAVRAGLCGIGPITHYDSASQKVHLAAEVKDWDPGRPWPGRDWKHMSRYAQFAMAAAQEAVADSGLAPGNSWTVPVRGHRVQRGGRHRHHRAGAVPLCPEGL